MKRKLPQDFEMLDAQAAADAMGVSQGTAGNWRVAGRGPKFYRTGANAGGKGGRIGYRLADIEEWLETRRFRSTGEADAAAR